MHQLCKGRVDDTISQQPEAQTEIEIVEFKGKTLIEAVHALERSTTLRKNRARHHRPIPMHQSPILICALPGWQAEPCVDSRVVRPSHNTRVLQPAVRKEQARADAADLGIESKG